MKKKILIVDDNTSYSSVLAAALKSKGYEVMAIDDSDQVLDLAEVFRPDVVLLDIMMPKMGGPEIRAEFLKRPSLQKTPVLYLTGLKAPGYGKSSSRSKGPKVRTIGKSEDLEELLKAISEIFID